jgi:hypothetical protein
MNPIRIRRFNDQGIVKVCEFLDSHTGVESKPVDYKRDLHPILTDPGLTSHVPNIVEADADRTFRRRYDLAEYLHGLIPKLGLADPTRDKGLWTWLALLWFDQLAPVSKGVRKVGEAAKWVPDYGRKEYRHLVLGPSQIFTAIADSPRRGLALLHNPPHTPGELVGQLAATQDVAQSKAAIGAATQLYYDMAAQKLAHGAGGSGAGSPRRFRTILDQLDRTFDLQSITEDRLLALLPKEFNRYKKR